MKLEDAWNIAEGRSTTASTIVRQLALAGFALVWLFKQEPKPGEPLLPRVLLTPIALLTVTVVCDLLQYVLSFLLWLKFIRDKETQIPAPARDTDIGAAPKTLNWPGYTLFAFKIIAITLAYGQLLQLLHSFLR
jgi:hypothetical protein